MKRQRQWTATILAALLVVLVTGVAVTIYHLVSIDRLGASVEQSQYQLISSIQQAVDTELRSIDNALLSLAFSRFAQGYMDAGIRTELSLVESLQGIQRQLFGIRAINDGVLSAWAVSFARDSVVSDASSSPLDSFSDRTWIRGIEFPQRDFRAVERRVQVHPRDVSPPETSDVLSIARHNRITGIGFPHHIGCITSNTHEYRFPGVEIGLRL